MSEHNGLPEGSLTAYLRVAPEHGSTTDAVVEALREAILDGAIPAGTWLREIAIAQELLVSRTPVREALRRLVDEGLLIKKAHSGAVVSPLSFDDVTALYVVRAQLEALAARLATERSPHGLVHRLEAVQAQMRRAVDGKNVAAITACNLEFHRTIRRATSNRYLERFLEQVEHAVRRMQPSTFEFPGRPSKVLEEHQQIIDAIADADPDAAAKVAELHMNTNRDLRIRSLPQDREV